MLSCTDTTTGRRNDRISAEDLVWNATGAQGMFDPHYVTDPVTAYDLVVAVRGASSRYEVTVRNTAGHTLASRNTPDYLQVSDLGLQLVNRLMGDTDRHGPEAALTVRGRLDLAIV